MKEDAEINIIKNLQKLPGKNKSVVNKIMELMNVDSEIARYYKTTLIKMVKDKNSNAVGLDLANEVEKLATIDYDVNQIFVDLFQFQILNSKLQ